MGYNVFIIDYSVKQSAAGYRPLKELAEAVHTVRSNSGVWNIDPAKVAVIGFSAGGHLAASLGILWNDSEIGLPADCRPDALVLGYPVITTGEYTHGLSSDNVSGGDPDVDVVLTTREMVRMFRGDQIDPSRLPETPFDSPLGTGTGAAVIFGATGGVMDAALRSAYYLVTGKNPDADAFTAVRGMDGWKEATFNVPGAGDVRVAVVSGLGNTRKLMNALDKGEVDYDFVEVMACPGGCAGGGGQPIHDGLEMAEYRGDVLWSLDKGAKVRFSHENPDVQALYVEYLKTPLGEKSHHLLHTELTSWDIHDVH